MGENNNTGRKEFANLVRIIKKSESLKIAVELCILILNKLIEFQKIFSFNRNFVHILIETICAKEKQGRDSNE